MSRIQEFDFSVDLLESILWQYNNAEKLQQILTSKNSWYETNQNQFWIQWFFNVFSLETANFFGLSVWSYILNIPLFIEQTPDPEGKPIWGTNVFTPPPADVNGGYNFENGTFTTRSSIVTLTLEEQRLLLRLRYYQLISRGATPDTNKFLSVLFQSYEKNYESYGIAYVLDNLDMSMTYVFNFDLSEAFRYIFQYYDVLPRPAGVRIKYIILTDQIFGFNEIDGEFPNYININQNFENGNFIPESL